MAKFSNNLSDAELERLAILSEECGEVIQVIGKIIRHGYESCHPDDPTFNRTLFEKELGDVKAIMQMMIQNEDIDSDCIEACKINKYKTVKQYLHHHI